MVSELWLDNGCLGEGFGKQPVARMCDRFTSQTLSLPLPTIWADFTGADKVALVAHQDDWCVWLGLPEEEAELGGAVETSPVSHWEDQDTHITLQSGQVLGIQKHTYILIKQHLSGAVKYWTHEGVIQWQLNRCGMSGSYDTLHKILYMPSTNLSLNNIFKTQISPQVRVLLCWSSAIEKDISANVRQAALKFLSLSQERTQRRLCSTWLYARHASLWISWPF